MPIVPSAEEIGHKLSDIRRRCKMSQEKAAQIAEVTTRTWGRYEKGQLTPPLEVLYKFAGATKTKIGEIIPIETELPGLGTDAIPLDPTHEIPILDEIPAGPLTEFTDDIVIGTTVSSMSKGMGLFALKVKGDSMQPEIEEGDIVILDRDAPFVNGRIYAARLESGETTLKRVFKKNGFYELIPMNENYESVRIYGPLALYRVVELHRPVK